MGVIQTTFHTISPPVAILDNEGWIYYSDGAMVWLKSVPTVRWDFSEFKKDLKDENVWKSLYHMLVQRDQRYDMLAQTLCPYFLSSEAKQGIQQEKAIHMDAEILRSAEQEAWLQLGKEKGKLGDRVYKESIHVAQLEHSEKIKTLQERYSLLRFQSQLQRDLIECIWKYEDHIVAVKFRTPPAKYRQYGN